MLVHAPRARSGGFAASVRPKRLPPLAETATIPYYGSMGLDQGLANTALRPILGQVQLLVDGHLRHPSQLSVSGPRSAPGP